MYIKHCFFTVVTISIVDTVAWYAISLVPGLFGLPGRSPWVPAWLFAQLAPLPGSMDLDPVPLQRNHPQDELSLELIATTMLTR